MRRLRDRIACLGCTVFDLIRSDISRFRDRSSRLDEVAFSICSSRAEVDVNQPAMVTKPDAAQSERFAMG